MEKFSKREAYRNGLALLESVLQAEEKGRIQPVLFHGFGALKELLLPLDNYASWSAEDLRYEKEVKQFHQLLEKHFDGNYKSAVASTSTSHVIPGKCCCHNR